MKTKKPALPDPVTHREVRRAVEQFLDALRLDVPGRSRKVLRMLDRLTTTNCWWAVYSAAPFIRQAAETMAAPKRAP